MKQISLLSIIQLLLILFSYAHVIAGALKRRRCHRQYRTENRHGLTIAIGAGLVFHATRAKIRLTLAPGVDAGARGQLFIALDGNKIADGEFLRRQRSTSKGPGGRSN